DLWLLDEGGLFAVGKRMPQRLTSSSFDSVVAVPSVDGKRLFAIQSRVGLQTLRYDPRSRQFALFPLRMARHASFSRDVQWLVFGEFRGKRQTLIRSRVDGREALQLATPPMEFWDAHWSPDGRQIAFVGRRPGGPYKVYVVSRDGGVPRQVVADDRN